MHLWKGSGTVSRLRLRFLFFQKGFIMREYVLVCAAVVLALGAGTVQGGIIANFDGGEGTTAVDQYPGVAGDGWVGAWQRHGSGSASVTDADPLNQGGNYLTSSATTLTQGVRRQYADYGDVGLDRPHTITFDFRADTLPAGWGTSTNYRVNVFDSDDPTAVTPHAHSSWMGIVFGGPDRLTWEFNNNPGTGTGWTYVDTGIELQTDVVYSFEITVYPGTTGPNYDPLVGPTYDLTILHPGGTYSAAGLGLRNDSGPGGYLNWSMQGTSGGATGFSLDSIRIVPEPTSAALLLCAMAAGLLCVPRRRSLRAQTR